MRIQNDSTMTQYSNKRNYAPKFNGTVSPEFVNYINQLRADCLKSKPESCATLINNICDGILNRTKSVMEKCFHPLSVLSIDTSGKINKIYDLFFVKNEIIHKLTNYEPQQGFVLKKECSTPMQRLLHIQRWIKGGSPFFNDVVNKNFHALITNLEYLMATHYDNADTLKEILNLLEWDKEHMELLRHEAPNINIDECEKLYDKFIPSVTQYLNNLADSAKDNI